MQPKSKNSQKRSLRIIGGRWRGRKLAIADADGLRPTGDRIRETLFNWLMPWLQESRCLDLFAGTGALGLEALSRGASHTTFIEKNPAVARQLQQHLTTLDCQQGHILTTDSLQWLEQTQAHAFDIVFVDPPFAENLWQPTLTYLDTMGHIDANTLIYIETPRDQHGSVPDGWQMLKNKASGNVSYGLWQRRADA